ncbi:MAG: transmembrane prediction [Acidobacteria bacterium]|nr:MAG: transmembrane prediction [Acidobacteriota bacterium]
MTKRKFAQILAGTSALFFGASTLLRGQEPVKVTRSGHTISVEIGGSPFTTYYFGTESPKPYLSPLRSAQGTIVTRSWPMVTDIPGEDHDHPHQRAMYFAHGDINRIDFWAEKNLTRAEQTVNGVFYPSEDLPKGRTVIRRIEEMHGGSHSGTVKATFDLVKPDGEVIGEEVQAYTFTGDRHNRTIDCGFTLRATHGPLKIADTKEGTFAIRVVHGLDSPPGRMVNSGGGIGEKEVWGKKANWVDYNSKVDGEEVGIAIFDNPQNLQHPTTWMARGYGLFSVNPFGLKEFFNDPKLDGSYTISSGGSLTLRYRVLIHHGDEKQADVAGAWRRYAAGR